MAYDAIYRGNPQWYCVDERAPMKMYVDVFGECKPFDPEHFVETYANAYFLDAPRIVPGIRQNSRYVEEEVQEILRSGFSSAVDVTRVMAWKAGKIKQRCSQESLSFEYNSDWKNWEAEAAGIDDGDVAILEERNSVSIPYFAAWVWARQKDGTWSGMLQNRDPQSILEAMAIRCPLGVGTTQLLCLLYFISSGEYPIIDRFAGAALAAISRSVCVGAEILDMPLWECLPEKGSKEFKTAYRDRVLPYCGALNDLFGGRWKTDRDIDRALWIYGHRFAGGTCR